ncbi:MAG: hypothetical protein ABI585_15610 [Betaproteobacteria bacterium]
MFVIRSVLLGTFLVAATGAFAASNLPPTSGAAVKLSGPTNKAANASFSSLTSFENPTLCQRVGVSGRVTVAGTINDGGGVEHLFLQIFDDGVLVSSVPLDLAVGFQATFDFTLVFAGTVQDLVPGIGLVVNDDPAAPGTVYASVDLIPPLDVVTCPGPGGNLTLVSNIAIPIPSNPVPGPAPAALWLLSVVLALAAWRYRR